MVRISPPNLGKGPERIMVQLSPVFLCIVSMIGLKARPQLSIELDDGQ